MDKADQSTLVFKVMVVDDSRLSRRVLIQELSEFDNIEISEHESPVGAVDKIDQFKPDLIISDYEMPEVNGLEFCKSIKEYEHLKEIPFIVISGLSDVDFKSKLLEAGVSETIPKGFKDKQLKKVVERYYRQKMAGSDYAVLIVDDSKINRKILSDMLRELNFKIFEVENPIQAEEILKNHPIDLILLDNEMPYKTGVEWCGELRNSHEFSNVSIISVSATKDISLTFLKAGADDFIYKPFTKEEVIVKVNQQLRKVNLERKLKNHIEREKALNHQKNILLGTAAHDIRNPIAAVISFLSLIKDNKYDDADTNFVIDNCYSSAESALELLNEILDVSNISSGVLNLDVENCFFTSLVADHIDAQSILGSKKEISIVSDFKIPDDMQIKLDPKRIGQVLDNLLSNAIKYSHSKTEVTVSLSHEADGLLVQVKDQGQGIPADELGNVFKEFKKTSVRTTAGESSTGLGLAIVKRIIDAHGGTIWVESEKGVGSNFCFTLPMNG